MTKKHGYIIKMPTKKVSKKETEKRKEKARKLLAKWIAQEIFRRNGIMNEVELWKASQQANCMAKMPKSKKCLQNHDKT